MGEWFVGWWVKNEHPPRAYTNTHAHLNTHTYTYKHTGLVIGWTY